MIRRAAFLFFLLAVSAPPARAIGEIQITFNGMDEPAPGRYVLEALVKNRTDLPREIILRGQITFYDKAAAPGDVPLQILRKDITIILKSGESRSVKMGLLNEGSFPRGEIRVEPFVRLRRQKPWTYQL